MIELPHDPSLVMPPGKPYWLFLDYDGTLADFAPTPDIISPDPEVIAILTRLAQIATLRVVILSGRRLDQVRALAPVEGLFISGDYGLEWVTPWGETIRRLEYARVRPVIEDISPGWRALIDGQEGYFLEDKGWSLALHARYARKKDAARTIQMAREYAKNHVSTQGYVILGGDRFIEIAPQEAEKGEGVRFALDHFNWKGAGLVYFGDDDKDEMAFGIVHERDGQAILVGKRRSLIGSRADYRLPSPKAVRKWLKCLADTRDFSKQSTGL